MAPLTTMHFQGAGSGWPLGRPRREQLGSRSVRRLASLLSMVATFSAMLVRSATKSYQVSGGSLSRQQGGERTHLLFEHGALHEPQTGGRDISLLVSVLAVWVLVGSSSGFRRAFYVISLIVVAVALFTIDLGFQAFAMVYVVVRAGFLCGRSTDVTWQGMVVVQVKTGVG